MLHRPFEPAWLSGHVLLCGRDPPGDPLWDFTRLPGSSIHHRDYSLRVLVWDSRVLAQEFAAGHYFACLVRYLCGIFISVYALVIPLEDRITLPG